MNEAGNLLLLLLPESVAEGGVATFAAGLNSGRWTVRQDGRYLQQPSNYLTAGYSATRRTATHSA